MTPIPSFNVDTILRSLQGNSNNQLRTIFPLEFNPIARMAIRKVKTLASSFEFLCVSWHGPWKKPLLEKRQYFQYFMEFLRVIKEKHARPMLIGGDFNIDLTEIKAYVVSPFEIHRYKPSRRREKKGVIDFFISTEAIDLQADSMRCIDMNEDTEEVNPTGVFDHDPIIATVALEQRTDTKGTTTLLVPVSALSASDQMKTLRYE